MIETTYYFNKNLQKKVAQIRHSEATYVVAPAGFGKTTAIATELKDEPCVHWFTAMLESHSCSFRRLSQRIKEIDPICGNKLLEIGYPNRINMVQVTEILQQLHVDTNTFLVLDNYQLLQSELFEHVLQALFENSCENLHVVIISQTYGKLYTYIEQNMYINKIRKEDLALELNDIAQWYSAFGVKLTITQLEELYQKTTGWILSVSMHLNACVEAGILVGQVNIDDPLDEIIWNRISNEQKELLAWLSFFDVWDQERINYLAEYAYSGEETLLRIPLVTYDKKEKLYYPHDILRNYLAQKRTHMDIEKQEAFYLLAGKWYDSQGLYREAIECYFAIKNYEKILAEDIVNLCLEPIGSITFTDVAEEIVERCPLDIKAAYILSYLRLAYTLFAQCKFESYDLVMNEAKVIIKGLNDKSLYGEWVLMSAFYEFPNVANMTKIYKQAATLLQGKSKIIDVKEPYMFGCTSMWALFHSEPGRMVAIADEIDEMISLYSKITGGHGSGAQCIYRGEVYCVQGKFEEAQLLAYKAAYFAETTGQVTISYGAALLLGIIATYRSDTKGMEEAVAYLESKARTYAHMENKALNQVMLDTVRGYLLGLLLETQNSPTWTRDTESMEMNLTFTNFMIYQSRVTDMILRKKYKQAIAHTEVLLTFDKRLCSTATTNFMHIGLTLCYMATGNIPKATYYLNIALSNSSEDQNFTFLARFRKLFSPLFMLPSIAKPHKETIQKIKELGTNYAAPDEEMVFQFIKDTVELPAKLSKREREIAILAAQGNHNKEIATILGISEWTVKTHLQSVYNKLNIDRRGKLSELLQ